MYSSFSLFDVMNMSHWLAPLLNLDKIIHYGLLNLNLVSGIIVVGVDMNVNDFSAVISVM